ncbi:MAG: lytic transglycosylase domain-containing protein [Rhodospirillales bacterium]
MNRPHRNFAPIRAVGALFALGLLAACSHNAGVSSSNQAARYTSHARGNYTAPGPAEDPWGPYIREASARFDVPEPWIRALMRVESGGKEYVNGKLVTSSAGAMGLMQVMPGTYQELRQRHNLGDDAYEPHDNIMAGVAYMREMYDIYGAPGFLAAYNAGPARLDDYLSNNRPLPDETRRYVAMIGPHLQNGSPKVRSPAEAYAMNDLPIRIPPGIRYGRNAQFASAGNGRIPVSAPVAMAQIPAPRAIQPVAIEPVRLAPLPEPSRAVVAAAPPPNRFALIASAHAAEPIPFRRPSVEAAGQWAIQVGAYANQGQAQTAVGIAKEHARAELAAAHPYVGVVHQARATLWRARLTGLSRDAAIQACEKLARGRTNCVVLSPEAQQS